MRTNTEKIWIVLAWTAFFVALAGTLATIFVGFSTTTAQFSQESIVAAHSHAMFWAAGLGVALFMRHKLGQTMKGEPMIFVFVFGISLLMQSAYQNMIGNNGISNTFYFAAVIATGTALSMLYNFLKTFRKELVALRATAKKDTAS